MTLYGHKLPVLSVSISSDSTLAVSGSADKSVRICAAFGIRTLATTAALPGGRRAVETSRGISFVERIPTQPAAALPPCAPQRSELSLSGPAIPCHVTGGLDFGDCHRSLYAHSESVMSVQFVRETHYFFSTGKDKLIKYWDADRFEQILTLRAHHAEVWSAVVSRSGDFIASVSRDRSLRVWRRTEEQVFVEEERENELEQLFEAGLEKQQQAAEAEEMEADALGMEGGQAEAGAAGRRTVDSVKGAERLLEALQTLADDDERQQEYLKALEQWRVRLQLAKAKDDPPPKRPVLVPNMLLLGLDQGGFLLKSLSSIRSSEVEQALLLLPFETVSRLLGRLLPLLASAPHAELMTRCVLFLLKVHHKTIVANRSMLLLLQRLDSAVRTRIESEQATIGYNLAAMRFVKGAVEQESSRGLIAWLPGCLIGA